MIKITKKAIPVVGYKKNLRKKRKNKMGNKVE